MATRALALVHFPHAAKRGEVIEIRTTLAHPMETGYRRDSDGRMLPRNVVNRLECHYEGELVFAADTFAAIAANPFVAFHLVAGASGPIQLSWSGDNGFSHSETVTLQVS